MPDIKPIRVMLVDDEHTIHHIVTEVLNIESDITLVGQISDGSQAVETYKLLQPDVVLVDVIMPILAGPDVTQALMEHDPAATIVALSSFREHKLIWAMLHNGAKGYVVKDAMLEELSASIRSIHSGSAVFSAEVAEIVLQGESPDGNFNLTERELEVLKLVGEGFKNADIAEQLEISINTVRFHLKNILAKMGVDNRSAALVLAAKSNLI